MITLIRAEAAKLIRRPRTYLGYLGVLLLLTPFLISFHYGGPEWRAQHQLGNDFVLLGTFINALFLGYTVLQFGVLSLFVPLFCSVVAGDMVAGEAAEGTLRALLVRPVRRGPVLAAKFIVMALHCFGVTLFLLAVALGLGGILFGVGDLFIFTGGIYVMPVRQALQNLLAAYLFAGLGVLTVASFAFLISTMIDNANGAIAGAMILLIVTSIFGQIPYFENVQPYLFTTHLGTWQKFFDDPVAWGEIRTSVLWLSGYIAACFAAALLIFSRKDILS